MKRLFENWHKYLIENQERKVNIFLDMDGVLVDFPTALKIYIKSIYAMDPDELHPESKNSRRVLRKLQRLQLNDEGIGALYDRSENKFRSGEKYDPEEKIMSDYVFKALLDNKELWLSMNKLEGADVLVSRVFELADEVFVLTAQVDETSKIAKKEWIAAKDHFPQIDPDNVLVDREKGARLRSLIDAGRVSENDLNILIDDRRKFLDDFIAAGGIGIQYNFESPGRTFQELERIIAN